MMAGMFRELMVFVHEEIQEILSGWDEESEEDLVEDLVREIRKESLLEERENMFYFARYRLQGILQSDAVLDDSQELDIKCRKCTERNYVSVVAKELIIREICEE